MEIAIVIVILAIVLFAVIFGLVQWHIAINESMGIGESDDDINYGKREVKNATKRVEKRKE